MPFGVTAGSVIPFDLAITDTYGNTFSSSFSYTVVAIDQDFTVADTLIVDDNNSDDVVSPGELGTIRISLTNTGASQALGIEADLTTTHPSVTVNKGDSLKFGTISGGSNRCGNTLASGQTGTCNTFAGYHPEFSVPFSVPVGTVIPFDLAITDTYGNTFSESFSYTVVAIDQGFTVTDTLIVDDDNSNDMVAPGETGTIRIRVTNTGASQALGITADLTTTNGSVTVNNGTSLQFGTISGGSNRCGNTLASGQTGTCNTFAGYHPSFTVGGGVAVGTLIPFNLAITDTYGNTFSIGFTYTVTAT